ncbi:MAG: hypothetical protein QM730_10730 [Anaerolineales bacterium]
MTKNHLPWVLILCFLITSCQSSGQNPTATLPVIEFPEQSIPSSTNSATATYTPEVATSTPYSTIFNRLFLLPR